MPKLLHKPDQALIKARGERIRAVREALGFSRSGFEDFGIQMGTLQNWEDGRRNGVTTKGAKRLVEAFKGAGAHVTVEWLLEAEGPEPIIAPKSVTGDKLPSSLDEGRMDAFTHQLLLSVHSHYHHVIDMLISNDNFSPMVRVGDCVAGFRYLANDIEKALNRMCIVQLKEGEMCLGVLSKDDYGLLQLQRSLKPGEDTPQAVEIHSAAPVIFILGQP